MSTSHIQLTAKYRPQAFSQVVGQEDVRAVLSRAAAQDRIAAAYLFSGTRGVGKTTLARIFAKAINCRTAPTPEPCNQCLHCRQITIGSAVDVAEIDGASNRGIEQARRLKEDVGYAPLEGRYKIIIIDEAHMLTKEAFNALLKTLEEPPPGVTFIMATTEPQKFPATIVSRCQHYVFKRLTQAQLDAHLRHVLEQEGRSFEPAATSLLARRAAGSVRDGMSLLEQVLTIGEDALRLEDVRRILGLAGGELFQRLVEAIRSQDCVALNDVLHVLLDQGLDLGFFLRELSALWRNLFLLRQAGEKALPLLELPEEEGRGWLAVASELSPTYIHAAWQMTLEGQRQVLTSLEPAQSLEMLLLNLTYLPQLLPLDNLDAGQLEKRVPAKPAKTGPAHRTTAVPGAAPGPARSKPGDAASASQASINDSRPAVSRANAEPAQAPQTFRDSEPARPAPPHEPPGPMATRGNETKKGAPQAASNVDVSGPNSSGQAQPGQEPEPQDAPRTWEGFLKHYDKLCKKDEVCLPGLRQVVGDLRGDELILRCSTLFQYNGLQVPQKWRALERLLREYFGPDLRISFPPPEGAAEDPGSQPNGSHLKHPLVRELVEQFQAKVVSLEPREK